MNPYLLQMAFSGAHGAVPIEQQALHLVAINNEGDALPEVPLHTGGASSHIITIDPDIVLGDTSAAGSIASGDMSFDEAFTSNDDGDALPEVDASTQNPPAVEQDQNLSAGDHLNRHSATGGSFRTVRMEDGEMAGTHVLMENAQGEVVGYLHYSGDESNATFTAIDENTQLPDAVVPLFTDTENPAIHYGQGVTEEAQSTEVTTGALIEEVAPVAAAASPTAGATP